MAARLHYCDSCDSVTKTSRRLVNNAGVAENTHEFSISIFLGCLHLSNRVVRFVSACSNANINSDLR